MVSAPKVLLLISILLPLAGALLVSSIGSVSRELVRRLTLVITGLTLLCSVLVVAQFEPSGDLYFQGVLEQVQAGASIDSLADYDPAKTAFAFSQYSWLPPSTGLDIRFAVGLDGLSVWMYGLSSLLMFTSVLVSWTAIRDRPAMFYAMLMLLHAGCLGVFAARDIVVFYIFFEFTLIPLFFLIGIWGSEERRYAANKFFLFTLAGSLLTLLGLLAVVLWSHGHRTAEALDGSIPNLILAMTSHPMPLEYQLWVFFALFIGFAIKVPLFPLHTWLPLAHVQAPTAGSVFLAGILLKIGTYGFLRFSLPMVPDASALAAPCLMGISVVGIIYGALVALAQADMKRLIAYSSVSHLGFCMLGLFALNRVGVSGAALQMINHGISTGALFALVGMLYERYHTREISQYGGMAKRLPILAFMMLLFTFSSIGLPGLNGFAGEIMILTGAFQRAWQSGVAEGWLSLRMFAILAVLGVVLGAWYMLWLVQRVFFGPLREPSHEGEAIADLNAREVCSLLPLVVLTFWIGIYPKFFLDRMAPALNYSTSAAAAAWDQESPISPVATAERTEVRLNRAH